MNTGSDFTQSHAIQNEIDDLERRLYDAKSRLQNAGCDERQHDAITNAGLIVPASKYAVVTTQGIL